MIIKKIQNIEFTKIILSSLLFLIIFYKVPIDIYYHNRSQFNNFSFILIPNLFLFLTSLIFYKKIYNNTFLFKTFLILALYVIISKILLPLDIDELEGHLELANENKYGVLIELISLILAYFIIKNLEKNFIKKLITIISIVFFLFSSYFYLRSFASTIKHQYNYFIPKSFNNHEKNFNSNPNIYLLTFDSFSSNAFEKIIKKEKSQSYFDGFTFFKNNSSNYSSTTVSVPSFLTGTMHDFDKSLLKFRNSYREKGLISDMMNKNYNVWQYVQSNSMQHNDVINIKTNVSLLLERSRLNLLIELYDYILLRLSPQFLHQEIYNNGSGIISKKMKNDETKSMPGEHYRALGSKFLMEEIIKEEILRADKGVFLHAHVYLPHGPYVIDEKAEYAFEKYDGKTGIKRYHMQSEGTAYLINKFLNKLKEQNKFDNSLIILNADTGSWEIGLSSFPNKYRERIDSINDNQRRLPAHQIFNQSKALLAIKYPNHKKLRISDKKTQNLDIYPTIINFSDENEKLINNNSGISLLDYDKIPDDRTVEYIVGYKQRKTNKHQWTTIEKSKGGFLDIFKISNKDFISKIGTKYQKW